MAPTIEQRKKERILSKLILKIFSLSGFDMVSKTENVFITIGGETCDFDNIFFHKNTIIFIERTISSNKEHIRKKKDYFNECKNNKEILLNHLKSKFSKLRSLIKKYSSSEINLVYLYVSYNTVEKKYQKRYSDLFFWDLKQLHYFLSLALTIKRTARHEIFSSIGISLENQDVRSSAIPGNKYPGMILPDNASGFPQKYKIISFFVDPDRLLRQAYVLRKHAWLDDDHLYQRILVQKKINDMRRYLVDKKRTFLNNIIVTLPSNVRIVDENDDVINPNSLRPGSKAFVDIPAESINIGIIDGQHRIFAYHEGDDEFESKISELRKKQHLLVTAVLYPRNLPEKERESFEAKLFLEINDKQTRIKSSLKHIIYTVVDPFSEIAIAKKVVQELSKQAPMDEIFETDYFDRGKLSTTSIVSYGIKYLVKLDGSESLFKIWTNRNKRKLNSSPTHKLLDEYINFCCNQLRILLRGFKAGINPDMWVLNQKKSKVLTATTINGLVHCLRLLIRDNKIGDELFYKSKLSNIESKIDFRPGKNSSGEDYFPYKSSHWKSLGEKIYNECF